MNVSGVERTGRPARERVPAAFLALLLQAGLLMLLLKAFPLAPPPHRPVRETVLLLPRLATPEPQIIDARGKAPRRTSPAIIVPTPEIIAPSPPGATAPHADIQSLGRALNGCAPETYANLSPEQRAACARPGEGVAVQQAPSLMGGRSHVKDEAHWREELAREQSPALMPCGGFVNVLCLLGKIADGSLGDYGDPRRWPHYEVEQISPEDFYKIEQAYDAWHKAHPESHLAPAH